ncbi:hypothetical protein FOCC_FOCC004582 [Frankliniella occidentalis]|nr:hypothetical protein FOCC_FOCC004582 [Frankliniella occidentalis]
MPSTGEGVPSFGSKYPALNSERTVSLTTLVNMTRGRASYPVTKLMSPEVGKWVTVNVNGNSHHEARILISPYTMRQFENLLSHLTDKLKPPFGAVWRLFTEDGLEIRDLEDIKGGQTYIASGRAKPMFPVR